MPPVPSSKTNNPVLTLMPGTDREWVVWTPQGYYDTSIDGDARFLAWHIDANYRLPQPTDFFPIGTYARTMRRQDYWIVSGRRPTSIWRSPRRYSRTELRDPSVWRTIDGLPESASPQPPAAHRFPIPVWSGWSTFPIPVSE